MSLSQSGGSLQRALVEDNAPSGGLTSDLLQLQAMEDREIKAISIHKRVQDAVVEVSFSSNPTIDNAEDVVESRASPIVYGAGNEQAFVDGLDLEWSDGEELHIHTVNNSGSGVRFGVVVHYVET